MLDSMNSSRPSRAPRRQLLAALVVTLALVPAMALAQGAPAGKPALAPKPDFSGWQMLLDRYCLRLPPKSPLQDTRFDYEKLYVDESIWTLKRSERLERIRSQLLSTPPSTLAPRDRRAWAINTYNFLVVERATLHLLVPNRQFLRYKSVHEIQADGADFFRWPVIEVEGRKYSIDEFGRCFVYGDSSSTLEPRALKSDPRLAFALCRGYVGGPPLSPRAFRGDSLEAQLDLASRRALSLPRFVNCDKALGTLTASNFFSELRVDFAATPNGEVFFIERFGPIEAKALIKKFKITSVTRFTPVDVKLNQFDRPKATAPGQTAPGTNL